MPAWSVPVLVAGAVAAGSAAAGEFKVSITAPAEVIAEAEPPEGAVDGTVLTFEVKGREPHQVTWFRGNMPSVFLGALPPGDHVVRTNAAKLRFRTVASGAPDHDVVANAPVLYARPDTLGRLSDVPLLVYCERINAGLQYTVIYSNEDGGTSTRALMARWGRTTDIEYTYRVDGAGQGTYQAKDHKDIAFRGNREAAHPVLFVATDNNMVSDEGTRTVRYQLTPFLVDLTGRPREYVMDRHPWTYRVAAEELEREHKIRAYNGGGNTENIGDPRNYVYVDLALKNDRTAVSVLIRRKGSEAWESSDLGRLDYAVSRDGVVRVAVEMPPGTKLADVAEVGLACNLLPDDKGKWPSPRPCVAGIEGIRMLDQAYTPVRDTRFKTAAVPVAAGTISIVR